MNYIGTTILLLFFWILHSGLALDMSWVSCKINDGTTLIASNVLRDVESLPSLTVCVIRASNLQWPAMLSFTNGKCTLWDKKAHVTVGIWRKRSKRNPECMMPDRLFGKHFFSIYVYLVIDILKYLLIQIPS